MRLEWHTGRPQIDGDYVVVFNFGYVTTLPFTKEYGWNTTNESTSKYAFADNEIAAWTEQFGKHVIDIYGKRDIMKEGE